MLIKFLIHLFLSVTWADDRGLFFKPYVGYGLGTLSFGETEEIDHLAQGYLLGVRTGYALGDELRFELEYSRQGPYEIKLVNRDIDLLFSGSMWGLGISGTWRVFSWGVVWIREWLVEEMSYIQRFRGYDNWRVSFGVMLFKGIDLVIVHDRFVANSEDISGVFQYIGCVSDACEPQIRQIMTHYTFQVSF